MICVKMIRILLALVGIFTAGFLMGRIVAHVTGLPDIFGVLSWDTFFVAISGAMLYSAVRK